MKILSLSKPYAMALCSLAGIGLVEANPSQSLKREQIHFEAIDDKGSLISPSIRVIAQDDFGFVWIGTSNGLARYDGTHFRIYDDNVGADKAMESGFIEGLAKDLKGDIWIKTKNGLCVLDTENEQFEKITLPDSYGDSPFSKGRAIFADSLGRVLLAADRRILVFDARKRELIKSLEAKEGEWSFPNEFSQLEQNKFSLSTDRGVWIYDELANAINPTNWKTRSGNSLNEIRVKTILRDSSQRFWIGSVRHGLYCLDQYGEEIAFTIEGKEVDQNTPFTIRFLIEDFNKNVWVGTLSNGILFLPNGESDFWQLKGDSSPDSFLPTDNLLCGLQLDSNVLLLGSEMNGLIRYNPHRIPVEFYSREVENRGSPAFKSIVAATEDETNKVWLIGRPYGISRLDLSNRSFETFLSENEIPLSLRNRDLLDIALGQSGELYLSIRNTGVFKFDPDSRTINPIRIDQQPEDTQLKPVIGKLLADQTGEIWIMTETLYRYNPYDYSLVEIDRKDEYKHTRFRTMSGFENSEGDLWLLSRGDGIAFYSKETRRIEKIYPSSENPNRLSSIAEGDIFQDSRGIVWIGAERGLTRFDPATGTFDNLEENPGLENLPILSIQEDSQQGLWLCSPRKISNLNLDTLKVEELSLPEGLSAEPYAANGFLRLKTAGLLAGGFRGINLFDPENLNTRKIERARPVIIGINLFDRPLKEKNGKRKPAHFIGQLDLDHDENSLAFEFANLNFSQSKPSHFAYRMKGMDEQWHLAGDRNEAFFPSLDPGDYVFQVKSANENGAWSESVAQVAISIAPPFWQTIPFQASTAAILVGYVVFSWRRRLSSLKKRNDELELNVANRTRELETSRQKALQSQREAELANKAKTQFLANISHEIRTPMNGIIGMNHMLLEESLDPKVRNYAEMIKSSANTLLALINDLLDISKIEAGKLDLQKAPFNLRSEIEEVIDLLALKAEEKGLKIYARIPPETPCSLIGDAYRIKQIVTNLIGNAIKFTEKGNVEFFTSVLDSNESETTIEFHVRDTGIGIDAPAMEKLFDAFTQVEASTTRKYEGTGLGLSISKRLVEMMRGEIKVASQPGEGSDFSFTCVFENQEEEDRSNLISDMVSGKNVLIWEQDEKRKEWIQSWIVQWKANPLTVRSATSCIEFLEAGDVDCLIIDRSTAELEGALLSEAITALNQELPIILAHEISAKTDQLALGNCRFSSQVTYPIKPSKLLKALTASSAEEKSEQLAISGEKNEQYANAKVLLVDDNPVNRGVAVALLEQRNINPDIAENGEEAYQAAQRERYDLILMDCMMPVVDGYEATGLIRSDSKNLNVDTPIVAITANAMQGDKEKCLDAGMNDYVEKPIRPQKMDRVLARWLASSDETVGQESLPSVEEPKQIINKEVMRELFSDDQESINKLMDLFMNGLISLKLELEASLKNDDDLVAAHLHAHTLKGSASNYGAEIVKESAARLEAACKAGDLQTAEEILPSVLEEIDRVIEAIPQMEWA